MVSQDVLFYYIHEASGGGGGDDDDALVNYIRFYIALPL